MGGCRQDYKSSSAIRLTPVQPYSQKMKCPRQLRFEPAVTSSLWAASSAELSQYILAVPLRHRSDFVLPFRHRVEDVLESSLAVRILLGRCHADIRSLCF